MAKRSLTGIKPTGIPHIANYIGAIRPALALGEQYDAYYFIADYHALTTVKDRQTLIDLTYEVAAAWLAMGLNPDRVTLYRQSDVPETFELTWILGCHAEGPDEPRPRLQGGRCRGGGAGQGGR